MSGTPKHQIIRRKLAEQIRTGLYRSGDRLPPLSDLAVQYGVSNSTVREAVSALVHEGLLVSSQGRGTYVADLSRRRITVGLVIPSVFHDGQNEGSPGADIMPHYVRSIESEVRLRGGNLMLKLDYGDEAVFRDNVLSLPQADVQGAIVLCTGSVQSTDCLYRAERKGLPVVLLDRRLQGSRFATVCTDNTGAACELTNLLISSEAAPVICIAAVQSFVLEPVQDRVMGYVRAMASRSQEPEVIYIDTSDLSNWYAAFDRVIAMRQVGAVPGVLFTHANLLVAFWRYLLHRQEPLERYRAAHFDETYMQPPQDLCVVTAVQSLDAVGRIAVDRLWALMDGKEASDHVLLPVRVRLNSAMNQAMADSGAFLAEAPSWERSDAVTS